jgi:hypothetical protein
MNRISNRSCNLLPSKGVMHGIAGCGKTARPVVTEGLALVTGSFYSLLAFCLFIFCRENKKGVKEFIESMENQLPKTTTICKCGKPYKRLLDIADDSITSISRLICFVGKPDTSYTEIAVFPCSSFVYDCDTLFVSFHFNKQMKYVGKSYGKIVNNDHVISGTGRLLDAK